MKKRKLKFIIVIVILIIGIISGYKGYYYLNKINFTDKESEQIIRNIITEHDIVIYKNNQFIDQFNNAVEAFGGVDSIRIEDNTVYFESNSYNINFYLSKYDMDNVVNFSSKEDYYEYICENYKYYNEDRIEVLLTIYNCNKEGNLSVNDLKSYINEGNTEKEQEVWDYIYWYISDGRDLFSEYGAKYSLIIDNENEELTKKYEKKIFYNLTVEEQKEVIKYLYNNGLVE